MELTVENVQAVFVDCLFVEGEDTSIHVPVKGITMNIGFHPARLEKHRQDVVDMLQHLPNPFHKASELKPEGGGGWSFLNAVVTEQGDTWTNNQKNAQELMILGIGLGVVEESIPREMWPILPGGVPYYCINLKGDEDVAKINKLD